MDIGFFSKKGPGHGMCIDRGAYNLLQHDELILSVNETISYAGNDSRAA